MFSYHDDYDSDDAYLDFSDSDSDHDDDNGVMEKDEAAFQQQQQTRKHTVRRRAGKSPEGSDFEQEMEAELSASVVVLANSADPVASTSSKSVQQSKASARGAKRRRRQTGSGGTGTSDDGASAGEYYDNVYFDSSSEEDIHSRADGASAVCTIAKRPQKVKKHRVMTNDELFYDPDIDDENEVWVADQLRLHRGIPCNNGSKSTTMSTTEATAAENVGEPREGSSSSTCGDLHALPQSAPRSDAVLACPACMTTLCLDCQRHDVYKTQFRAMFVMNCTVSHSELLRHKIRLPRSVQRKRRKNKGCGSTAESAETMTTAAGVVNNGGQAAGDEQERTEECYHPVHCAACNTEVAVYDRDEVYHFYNVLASHA